MSSVQIDWSTASVKDVEGIYDLEVHFREPSPPHWWEAFSSALEILSRETTGARWQSIRGVGEPPAGLHVSGVDESSVQALRSFLDSAVRMADEEALRAERVREQRRREQEQRTADQRDSAERLTEAFRSGSTA
jgi:hypothetical protein